MTIIEMKNYLDTLIADGHGENRFRTCVTDSYKNSYYGVEATLNTSRTLSVDQIGQTNFYFSIDKSNCQTHADVSKNTITAPCISFRKQ